MFAVVMAGTIVVVVMLRTDAVLVVMVETVVVAMVIGGVAVVVAMLVTGTAVLVVETVVVAVFMEATINRSAVYGRNYYSFLGDGKLL